ncbi:MAG: hypothetical protein ACT4P5_06565 [Armatimonadota bacterium]
MSVYGLCKAIHHLYINRETAMAARAADFTILDRFDLEPEERQAIERRDLVALYRLGAHPLLLFHFAVVMDARERYVREVVPQLQGLPNPFYDYYQRHRSYVP